MESQPPPPSHSFVVKIWTRETEDPCQGRAWRGRVTHVGSQKRRYVQGLLEIPAFLLTYVREMGGRVDLKNRLCLWLASWSSSPSS
jgi:hypothetical protein